MHFILTFLLKIRWVAKLNKTFTISQQTLTALHLTSCAMVLSVLVYNQLNDIVPLVTGNAYCLENKWIAYKLTTLCHVAITTLLLLVSRRWHKDIALTSYINGIPQKQCSKIYSFSYKRKM